MIFDIYESQILVQLWPLHRSAEDVESSWDFWVRSADEFEFGVVFSQWWFLGSLNPKPFDLSYLSLFDISVSQSQEYLLHHIMALIIYLSQSEYLNTVHLAVHSTWVQWDKHLDTPTELIHICNWRLGLYQLQGNDWVRIEMHIPAETEWTERCIWRLWSSKFGDELRGHNTVNLWMHLEVAIAREFKHVLRGRDWWCSKMQCAAVIETVGRCTWTPWWSTCWGAFAGRDHVNWDTLGGDDRVSWEMHLEAVIK